MTQNEDLNIRLVNLSLYCMFSTFFNSTVHFLIIVYPQNDAKNANNRIPGKMCHFFNYNAKKSE